MTLIRFILTALGVIAFWCYLNFINLFKSKKRRHHYTFDQLWEGRIDGAHPDNRPYSLIGLIVFIIMCTLPSIRIFY